MSIFAKHQVVLWPKSKSTEVYFDRKDNNSFSFDISLWQELDDNTISAFSNFVKENGISNINLLVPDNIVITKSFVYDSKIDSIEKSEVVSLAQGFVNFTIDPEYLSFTLLNDSDNTIIQAHIINQEKFKFFAQNISKLNLNIVSQLAVSESIAKVINTFYQGQYFFIYPLENNEVTLSLAKDDLVYLTNNLKGSSLDIQKIINYSNLYFKALTSKIFLPSSQKLDITSTTELEKTDYDDKQIAQNLSKPVNLPLPVLGAFNTQVTAMPKADIIKENKPIKKATKTMEENKKNILPVIAVFLLTAGLASLIFWYVVNRNNSENIESPMGQGNTADAQPTMEVTPTIEPTPTIAIEVDKTLKIQVLNATDINGQAATLKAKLTALGFKNVAVGNATDNLVANQIKLKTDYAEYQSYFESELGTFFPATYTDDLKSTSTYDIVFYIGTDLSKADDSASATSTDEATSTATPTKKVTATPTDAE